MEVQARAQALQPELTARFTRLIKRGTLAHAYLLVGPAGSGKQALADWVALSLFCSHRREGAPDGTCPECQRILAGNHPDVVVAKPEGRTIKVDQLRHLKAEFTKRGVEGNQKVFIIDGADRLTTGAANSLLKFIEEPGAGIYIFLLTANKQAVLPTIQSRTQVVELRPLNPAARADQLAAAGVPTRLQPLATALELAPDQLAQLVSDDWLTTSVTAVGQWLQELAAGDPMAFVDVQVALVKQASDRLRQLVVLDLVALAWRDLLLMKNQAPDSGSARFTGWQRELEQAARRLTASQVLAACTLTLECRHLLDQNISFQNVLEQLTLRILAIPGVVARR